MSSRDKLTNEGLSAFLSSRVGWFLTAPVGAPAALEKIYTFKDYPSGVAFAVRVAFAAERRDHHPNIHLYWGKVHVAWSTHDAGGVTEVDTQMADVTDALYAGA